MKLVLLNIHFTNAINDYGSGLGWRSAAHKSQLHYPSRQSLSDGYWIFMLQVYQKYHHQALITASTLEVQIGVCALSHVAGDNH
mgnify:CR=1 FL=1